MAGQGESFGPAGADGGHGLLLRLTQRHQQGGGDQPGATAPPLAVDDQVFAVAQQFGQLRQRL
ncbi:hypothetical protein D3C85_1557860 [compost metagenome]